MVRKADEQLEQNKPVKLRKQTHLGFDGVALIQFKSLMAFLRGQDCLAATLIAW